jgi:ABC-2 type transport system permease protein
MSTTTHTVEPDIGAIWNEAQPIPSGPVSASLAFAWRAILKIKHVPEQLADVIGIPVLFTLLFTYLFGGALAGSTTEYLRYLLPGTLVLALVFVTIYSGATLNRDLATGAFDRFRSMPIWRPAPIVGALLGDVARYALGAGIVLGIGFAMGYRTDAGVLRILAAVGLTIVFSSALSWVWTTIAMLVRTPQAVMNLGFVILFPLTFVSNIFVEPRTMPNWLHTVADANPITHLATAARQLMSGTAAGPEVTWILIASVAIAAVFAPLTIVLYRRR